MPNLLAIDPGPTESGLVIIDVDTCRPLVAAILQNDALLTGLRRGQFVYDEAAIEMVASYGMPVGAEVFETCVFIGICCEAITHRTGVEPERVPRLRMKVHHCHDSRANDSNITRALVDRFAAGQPNFGKGTKGAPGWFYGFTKDVWQAYALAVRQADVMRQRVVV